MRRRTRRPGSWRGSSRTRSGGRRRSSRGGQTRRRQTRRGGSPPRQMVESRHQLTMGQIAGGPEQDHDAWLGNPRPRQSLPQRVAGFGDALGMRLRIRHPRQLRFQNKQVPSERVPSPCWPPQPSGVASGVTRFSEFTGRAHRQSTHNPDIDGRRNRRERAGWGIPKRRGSVVKPEGVLARSGPARAKRDPPDPLDLFRFFGIPRQSGRPVRERDRSRGRTAHNRPGRPAATSGAGFRLRSPAGPRDDRAHAQLSSRSTPSAASGSTAASSGPTGAPVSTRE